MAAQDLNPASLCRQSEALLVSYCTLLKKDPFLCLVAYDFPFKVNKVYFIYILHVSFINRYIFNVYVTRNLLIVNIFS